MCANLDRLAIASSVIESVALHASWYNTALWAAAVIARITCRAVPAEVSCAHLSWFAVACRFIERVAWLTLAYVLALSATTVIERIAC